MIVEVTRLKDNKTFFYKDFNELIEVIKISDTCNNIDDVVEFLEKYNLRLEVHNNIKYSDIC